MGKALDDWNNLPQIRMVERRFNFEFRLMYILWADGVATYMQRKSFDSDWFFTRPKKDVVWDRIEFKDRYDRWTTRGKGVPANATY